MFPTAMWRFLAPYLIVAVAIASVAMLAYQQGAPAWVVHIGVLLGGLAVLPGYLRWESRQG